MNNRIQVWFDQMVRGLSAQKWTRSMSPYQSSCSYRGYGGKKCAVGQIISDDCEVIKTGNNYPIFTLKNQNKLTALGLGEISLEEIVFLSQAQDAHDVGFQQRSMYTAFQVLSSRYKLIWPSDVEQNFPDSQAV